MSPSSKAQAKGSHEDDDTRESHDLERRKEAVMTAVQAYAHVTLHDLRVASRSQTEELLSWLNYMKLEDDDIRGWEVYVNGTMQRQLASAQQLSQEREHILAKLNQARREKVIGEELFQKKMSELFSSNIDYKDRERYMQDVLPERLKAWEDVKKLRDTLVKDPDVRALQNANIANFDTLFDADAFAELKWEKRKKLVEMVSATLSARKNDTEKMMPKVEKTLEQYRDERLIHSSKVGTWMKHIFSKHKSEAEITKYMATMSVWADRWREAKKRFDTIEEAMTKEGVPRGFRTVSEDEFLLMHYKERTSYCSLAEIRLENIAEEDKQLASLKLRIRYSLATEDWRGAEQDLRKATDIRQEDRELESMQNFLESHRHPEEEIEQEQKDPQAILASMRETLKNIEGDPADVYAWALTQGEAEYDALSKLMYNLVWVHEHNYSSEAEDIERERDEINKRKTQQYVENGYSKQVEYNILSGDTAKAEAVRDECTKAQILYVASDGKEALKQAISENKNNEDVKYWTSVKWQSLGYGKHREIVKNHQRPLMQGLRDLDAMGYRFTLAGELKPKHSVSLPEKEAKQSNSPQYSLSA